MIKSPPQIKPDFSCPVCGLQPMRPSHYAGEYFYYVCQVSECDGKRGFKMTRYNEFREILNRKPLPREGDSGLTTD